MSRSIREFVVAMAISATVMLAGAASAPAARTIAKFAPSSNGSYAETGFPFNPVFTTGDSAFVARMVTDKRMTIQRIGRNGRITTVATVNVDPNFDGDVSWAGSNSIVVASTRSVLISEQDDSMHISHRRLFAGRLDRPLTLLDKCTIGRFSVSGTKVAELSRPCGKTKLPVIKVFELRGESFKRVASTPLPGEFANLPATEFDVIGPLGFNDRFAILQHGGEAVVFKWRNGGLVRRIALTDGNRVLAAEFNRQDDVVFVEQDSYGDLFVNTYSLTSNAGEVTTALGRGSFLRRLNDKLLFKPTTGTSSGDSVIFSFDINGGGNSTFGVLPTWPMMQDTAWRSAGTAQIGPKRIVWAARTCFWERVFTKPLAESVTIPADDCPVNFIDDSARLQRRQVSVDITSPRGFSGAYGSVSWDKHLGFPIHVQSPPGNRKLLFPVSARQAKYLRNHPETVLTIRIDRENHDDLTYSGVLHR